MAQNITIMGASYSDVPAVTLPKTGGGTASFTDVSDTTAAAADVASGKYFYTAAGVRTQGTASGGGGGGATNFVQGEFTTTSSTNTASSISIPYTGSGYPIAAMVWVAGGAYNNGTGGNTDWYNLKQRYAVGEWVMTKAQGTTTPTWATSGAANYGVVAAIYKNSTSSATSYTRTSSMTTNTFTSASTNAANAAATCVRFKGNSKTLSYFVASTSYGLLANTKYQYCIVYSS